MQDNGHTGPLRFSAFVPSQLVNAYFSDDDGLNEALLLFKANKISKVYLDCLRGGHFPGEEVLTKARDFFRNNGLEVSAGLTPTDGTGKRSTHGRWWLCYTNLETQEELEEIVRRTARIFDEIIVDDFLCTHCHCSECDSVRGDQEWGEYYRNLLAYIAKDKIIYPAREENPNVRVIIKYPQWYDRFHVFGYDVEQHPFNFDEVWVGTEIRDPLVEYVNQYQAFANYSWLASISQEKIGGGWFDFINCYPEIYVEQAVQSILAGARELIRFHYEPGTYSTENPNTKALLEAIPELEKLAEILDGHKPEGIAFYKPVNTDGEDEAYILDYLGMLGLPIVPCHQFPEDAKSICLSIQSADDPDIVERVVAFVEKGGIAMLTPGFLEKFAFDERILRLSGYANPPVTPADIWTFRFSVNQSSADAEAHIHFGANLHPVTAEVLATAIHPKGNIPVLTRNNYGNGKVIVFNAKTFRYPEGSGRVTTGEPVSLPNMPQSLVDTLRSEMISGFPFEVKVRSKVGIYYYSDILVLTNFNDQSVYASVALQSQHNGHANDPITRRDLGDWSDGKLSFEIPGRKFVVLSWRLSVTSDLERVLQIIDGFAKNSSGLKEVDAQSLEEYLLIQLKQLNLEGTIPYRLVSEGYWKDLDANRYPQIAKNLGVTLNSVREAIVIIASLELIPKRPFNTERNEYIIPDFIIEKINDEYKVLMNDYGSRLGIGSYYKDILDSEDESQEETKKFMQSKSKLALWFLEKLELRRKTIHKVAEAIFDVQKDFLEKGPEYLKPLTLKNVADVVGVHEATVSRVVRSRYAQTPQGIFELIRFFSR